MQLVPVFNNANASAFLEVHAIMHLNNPAFIRPLYKDINAVFDYTKNRLFKNGDCKRWIHKDDNQKLIGRIAAFVSEKYKNKDDDIPVGGFGFFD
jgi:hypothetical protein